MNYNRKSTKELLIILKNGKSKNIKKITLVLENRINKIKGE